MYRVIHEERSIVLNGYQDRDAKIRRDDIRYIFLFVGWMKSEFSKKKGECT